MKTYLIRSDHNKWYLDFNCYINEERFEKKGGEISSTHKEWPNLINSDGSLVNENDDRLWDQDWVYISDTGKILHIDTVPAIKLNKVLRATQFNEDGTLKSIDEFDQDAYEKAYNEWEKYMRNPKLLNEKEDLIFSSKEARKERRMLNK